MSEVHQLILDTKESIAEYTPKLLAACDQIAEMAQKNEAGWVDLLNQFFEGIDWLLNAVTGIRKLRPEEFIAAPIEEVMMMLQNLTEALEAKDMVAACDILQFELKGCLEGIIADAQ